MDWIGCCADGVKSCEHAVVSSLEHLILVIWSLNYRHIKPQPLWAESFRTLQTSNVQFKAPAYFSVRRVYRKLCGNPFHVKIQPSLPRYDINPKIETSSHDKELICRGWASLKRRRRILLISSHLLHGSIPIESLDLQRTTRWYWSAMFAAACRRLIRDSCSTAWDVRN